MDIGALAEKVLLHPVALIALGVLLVLGLGHWVQSSLDAKLAGDPAPASGLLADSGTGGVDAGSGDTGTGAGGSAPGQSGDGAIGGGVDAPAGSPDASAGGNHPSDDADAPDPGVAPAGAGETEPNTGQGSEPAGTSGSDPVDPAIQVARARIDRSGGAAETMLITVYYADGLRNGLALQPVQMRVPRQVARIALTAEQIVNAPEQLRLYSNLPEGTRVQSVDFDPDTGVATVDLSKEAAGVQGSSAAATIMASFVYSLTEIPGVEAVRLWINGYPAELHGIIWDRPLTRKDVAERNPFKILPVIEYDGPASS